MAERMRAMTKVAVVGGGIAGLTAALRLRERGFEVKVFERRTYLGGKLGAHRHRYFRVKVTPAELKDIQTRFEPPARAATRRAPPTLPEKIKRELEDAFEQWDDRVHPFPD